MARCYKPCWADGAGLWRPCLHTHSLCWVGLIQGGGDICLQRECGVSKHGKRGWPRIPWGSRLCHRPRGSRGSSHLLPAMTAKDHVVHPLFSTQNTWTVQGPGAGDTTLTRTNWSLVFFHLYLGQTSDKQVIKNRYRQV